MKTHFMVVILTLTGLLPLLHAAENRTWTASDGRQIEASLVSATAEEITIRKPGGPTFTLKPDQVSAEDREYVKKFLTEQEVAATPPTDWKEGPYADFCDGEWQKMTAESGLRFHFFANKRSLKKDQLYPLCIYLHGRSNVGSDLKMREPGANAFANEEFYDERPCIVIAPEAPAGTGGFKDISGNIFALIDDLTANLPIDKNRIYITGYSMGSQGSWDLIMEKPELFAAAVPVGGPMSAKKAASVPKIPIWVHYGELDRKDEFTALLAALKDAGNEVKFTEHKGADHVGFHNQVAKDEAVHEWIFS
ncbi:MAG: dienelactone hydrolase family protein, partial [Akkermansiaceae bacterium]|nr:dienelactone hydrolase family protein [Akkermansiaceae bacterium]